MKVCLACGYSYTGKGWVCPRCGVQSAEEDGLVHFCEDPPDEDGGFKQEYFARLAQLEPSNFWFRARNQLIVWALQTYFPTAKSLFEVGCGTGFVLAGIREAAPGMRLAASEIFRDGLIFAGARLPGVDLYQMDARQIPFEDEFDVVGAFDVLEHIGDDQLVLSKMFKATRPGGGILLTVPQHPFLWSDLDRHSMHQRRYRRAELRSKVERARFRVERITSFVSFLLPLMFLARKKRKDGDLWAEFRISQFLNASLEKALAAERALIRQGVSFPAGGSLLLVARKPAFAS
ncbi:MAG TPA: methyltransferase domain-containing protein [Chthoniobacterales bacterium]|jgi:SAM-dependent methyltransferase